MSHETGRVIKRNKSIHLSLASMDIIKCIQKIKVVQFNMFHTMFMLYIE